mmetsp:Transcript_59004/g.140900  ORF Transcript_59004/g.140900 Transcript_59004/m.140900 type:complete len:114 (+) Transcript_59004:123-464(+)
MSTHHLPAPGKGAPKPGFEAAGTNMGLAPPASGATPAAPPIAAGALGAGALTKPGRIGGLGCAKVTPPPPAQLGPALAADGPCGLDATPCGPGARTAKVPIFGTAAGFGSFRS